MLLRRTLTVLALLGVAWGAIPSGLAGWNDDPATQYHVQTDEGPERYFRYQTQSGQYRKEKRLEDGTVIGTYGWVDPTGVLLLRDYVADNAGYRIVRTKKIFVGTDDAKSATPPKAPIVVVQPSPSPVPAVVRIPKPVYVAPAQSNNLYDHPESATRPQASNFGAHPFYTGDFGEYEPVLGYQRKKTGFLVRANAYATPTYAPVTPTYAPPANALEYGVRKQPSYAPIRVYTPEQEDYVLRKQAQQTELQYKYQRLKQTKEGEYDGVSTTQNGFKYFLPRQYHEETEAADSSRAGSYGYVDPFGIRRVVYYNSAPGQGFTVKKNNRYVGLDAAPYDPRP